VGLSVDNATLAGLAACHTSAVCSKQQLEDWLAASAHDAAAMNPREPKSFWLVSLMNTEGADNEH